MKQTWIPAFLSLCATASAADFKPQTIDAHIGIGYGLAVADVNGDRRPDVLLVDMDNVAWYENPTWEKHVISGKLTDRDHVCIAARDIDGDGKAEIAVGAGWNPGDTLNSGAVFYLKAPEDRAGKWEAIELPHEPTVHRMHWVQTAPGKFNLVVAPLHGRGNKNGAGEGVRLLEYWMPENPNGEWKTTLIEGSMHQTHNFDPVQWDADAAEEMLYAGKEGILLLDRKESGWDRTVIASPEKTPGFEGAGEVREGHAPDGRFVAAIEPMHGNNLTVYTRSEGQWRRKVLDSELKEGHALATGDLLKQGRDQIVAGWRGKNAQGKVGINLYAFNGTEWKSSVIDDDGMACEDLKVADLNGDGRLDIVAAGRATKNVKIYWNVGRE